MRVAASYREAVSTERSAVMDEQCGVACNLVGPEFAARKERITEELFANVEQVDELPDGFAFRFPPDEPWPVKIIEFVIAERQCCPFFRFEVVFEPNGGPLWLRLTGEKGAKAFLASELGLPAAGG
jgi:hypothetical protein